MLIVHSPWVFRWANLCQSFDSFWPMRIHSSSVRLSLPCLSFSYTMPNHGWFSATFTSHRKDHMVLYNSIRGNRLLYLPHKKNMKHDIPVEKAPFLTLLSRTKWPVSILLIIAQRISIHIHLFCKWCPVADGIIYIKSVIDTFHYVHTCTQDCV